MAFSFRSAGGRVDTARLSVIYQQVACWAELSLLKVGKDFQNEEYGGR